MNVIVLREPGRLVMDTRPDPVPDTGEVVLRIRRIGVCGTDLHAYGGDQPYFHYPRVLGHELCGELMEPFGAAKKGELFSIIPYRHCGSCNACRSGKTNCCRKLSVIGVHEDGGMAEFIAVRKDLLVPGNGLSSDELAIVEPYAIGAHAIRRAGLTGGETVMVVGAGPIGHGIIRQLMAIGVDPILLERSPVRLEMARRIDGLRVMDANDPDLKDELLSLFAGEGADVIFEATGNLSAIAQMPVHLAHGGKMILVGLQQDAFRFSHPEFHRREATLMSSRNATREDFIRVMEHLSSGRLKAEMLINSHASFNTVPAVFPSWTGSDSPTLKAVIDLN